MSKAFHFKGTHFIFFPSSWTNGSPIESKFSDANEKACSTHLAATSMACLKNDNTIKH